MAWGVGSGPATGARSAPTLPASLLSQPIRARERLASRSLVVTARNVQSVPMSPHGSKCTSESLTEEPRLSDGATNPTDIEWLAYCRRSFRADDATTIAAAYTMRALLLGWGPQLERLEPIESDAILTASAAADALAMLELLGRFLPTNALGSTPLRDQTSPHANRMTARQQTRNARDIQRRLSAKSRPSRRLREQMQTISGRETRLLDAASLMEWAREEGLLYDDQSSKTKSGRLADGFPRLVQSPCIEALSAAIAANELLAQCVTYGANRKIMEPDIAARIYMTTNLVRETLVTGRYGLMSQALVLLALP